MAELDTPTLEKLIGMFFTNQRATVQAEIRNYSLDELIHAFENLRRSIRRLLNGLNEDQLVFSPDANTYSLSEIFTHLVSAQGGTYNAFLDLTASTLPHIDPVPRGPGAGAQKGVDATALQAGLQTATESLIKVLRATYVGKDSSDDRKMPHPFFGELTYKEWMFAQLAHDLDHLKQAQAVRRSADFPKKVRAVS